jgi:hypothetical protein
MKLILPILALTLAASACSTTTTSSAALSQEELQKLWTDYATPGDEHALLGRRIGRWTFTMKWYTEPGAPPMESQGTSQCRWILGGRFIEDTTVAESMGQPFEGLGTAGFDNLTRRYESTWVDNMSTGIFHATGTYDAATRTFHHESVQPDFASGGYVPSRMVERWIDDDHYVLEAYGPGPDGRDMKTMEIVYARAR